MPARTLFNFKLASGGLRVGLLLHVQPGASDALLLGVPARARLVVCSVGVLNGLKGVYIVDGSPNF